MTFTLWIEDNSNSIDVFKMINSYFSDYNIGSVKNYVDLCKKLWDIVKIMHNYAN